LKSPTPSWGKAYEPRESGKHSVELLENVPSPFHRKTEIVPVPS
jgi:hypothetical protein